MPNQSFCSFLLVVFSLSSTSKQPTQLTATDYEELSRNCLSLLKSFFSSYIAIRVETKVQTMKFLGWMCHRFCGNSKEPLKDSATGNNCFRLDDQEIYSTTWSGPTYKTGFMKQLNKLQQNSDNIEENLKDERISEHFHGFLAIGTLGLDEPATPTFGLSLDNPMEENAEVTENDLKFISDELEKFVEADAEEGRDQPSGRNSDAITNALVEGANTKEDSKTVAFPLQGYMFRSSAGAKKEKSSVGELFQRRKMQERWGDKCGKKVMQSSAAHSSAKHLMKKLLKKIHSSSKFSSGGRSDLPSPKDKFQKIMQIFHRKVHPVSSITEEEINNNTMRNAESKEPNWQGIMSKKGNSGRNGEHWIKTDAEYFVLEL